MSLRIEGPPPAEAELGGGLASRRPFAFAPAQCDPDGNRQCCGGGCARFFLRYMARLALAGVRVEGQSLSEKFPQQVECVAAHVVQGLDGMVVNQVLTGLGYDDMMLVLLCMALPSTGRQ